MHLISKDNPGVYLPPPLIYVLFFFLSVLLQRKLPIPFTWHDTLLAEIVGWGFIVLYLIFFLPAVRQFILSKNTLVTIRPANALQKSGIYSVSRNPMYLSLLFLYSGIAMFKGNPWTMIEIPLLMATIQGYVIKKEEQYLLRRFNVEFEEYMKNVRRWI